MAIIRNQIITTTGRDNQGDRVTEQEIRLLFNKLKGSMLLTNQHDISKPPIGRMFNKKLVTLPNGDLAIKVDIEVLDEEEFKIMGGASISFSRKSRRIGSGNPSLKLLVNPLQFDLDKSLPIIAECVPENVTIDVTEKIEKSAVLQTAVVVVLVYAGMKILDGFLSAVGEHLFDRLKWLPQKEGKSNPVKLVLNIENIHKGRTIILSFSNEIPNASDLNFSKLEDFIKSITLKDDVVKVIGTVLPDYTVFIEAAYTEKGDTIKLNLRSPPLANKRG